VVVEGIETAEQADYFRKIGGTIQGQGWYYGRPVSTDSIHELFSALSAAPEWPTGFPVLDPATE
jgi:sensor c-di-GMP phosphodiesterase-like protein